MNLQLRKKILITKLKLVSTNLKNSIVLLVLISISPINAQIFEDIYLEGEAITKYSVGEESRKTIVYQDNVTAMVPEYSKFNSPVYGLNFSLNYRFRNSFSTLRRIFRLGKIRSSPNSLIAIIYPNVSFSIKKF